MARRHGWEVEPAAIFTTHGLVSACAISVQAFTAPGEGVILFTPVYHAFHRIVAANGTLHCDGHVVAVWVDRHTGKPTELPNGVRRALETLLRS